MYFYLEAYEDDCEKKCQGIYTNRTLSLGKLDVVEEICFPIFFFLNICLESTRKITDEIIFRIAFFYYFLNVKMNLFFDNPENVIFIHVNVQL